MVIGPFGALMRASMALGTSTTRPLINGLSATSSRSDQRYIGIASPFPGFVSLTVDFIGAPLESNGEFAEGGLEHGAHQYRQRPAFEFVVDEEFDFAGLIAGRREGPAVLQAAERAVEILDQNFQRRSIEGDAAGEGLLDQFVGHRHRSDDDRALSFR